AERQSTYRRHDGKSVHPCPRHPADDDRPRPSRATLDCRSSQHDRRIGEARYGARGKADSPAYARSCGACGAALRFPRLSERATEKITGETALMTQATTLKEQARTATEGPHELTDGFHLIIDALKLNGLNTIYGVPGIPITDFGRMAQAAGIRVL